LLIYLILRPEVD